MPIILNGVLKKLNIKIYNIVNTINIATKNGIVLGKKK